MAGPTFAEGEVNLHLDGSSLPRESAAEAAKASRIFSATWNSQMAQVGRSIAGIFRGSGLLAGINFASGFRTAFSRIGADIAKFARSVGSKLANSNLGVGIWMGFTRAREAIEATSEAVQRLGTRIANSDMGVNLWMGWTRGKEAVQRAAEGISASVRKTSDTIKNSYIGQRFAEVAEPFRRAWGRIRTEAALGGPIFEKLAASARKVGGIFRSTSKDIDKQGSSWKNLSANTRQWILIIAAVAASMGQLAPLASAAAAGLVILGGALAAVVLGVGVGIAAFQGLTGEISALPAAVQPAAVAFQSIGDAFGKMQEAIQIAALSGAAPAFDSLRATVEALIPAMEIVGATVGRVIGMFAASIAPGTAGFANLEKIIVGLAPVIESLAQAGIIFGEALGNVFVIALPYVQQFGTYLVDIANQFLAFTQLNPGVIDQWFANGVTILSAFGDLLGAVGTALAELVTPDTVAITVQFLDSLTGFIPALTGILQVLAGLNIFGLLAAALDAIGPAIEVLVPPLTEIATVVSGVLLQAFTALAPVIANLAAAFAPVLTVIGQLIGAVLPPLITMLMPIIQAVASLAIQLISALMPAFNALIPAVVAILAALQPFVDLVVSLIAQLGPILVPIIQLLAGVVAQLVTAFVPIIEAIMPPLLELVSALIPVIIQLVDGFVQLLTPILALIDPLVQMIGEIVPPLAELITALLIPAVDLLSGAFDFLIPVIQGVINLIVSVLTPVIQSITKILKGVIDFIVGVFTGDWERAWGGLAGIVTGVFEGVVGIVEGAINGIIDLINGMIEGVNAVGGALGISLGTIPKVYFAAGGILNGPTNLGLGRVAGEAGPEAIVPLNRPLGAVDPSVRGLSAVAQGLALPGTAPGKTVIVEEGAFQFIVPSEQAGRVIANSVLDNLVASAEL